MSNPNLLSQSPISNNDIGGFATFTNGNIYKTSQDELQMKKITVKHKNILPTTDQSLNDYTANLVIPQPFNNTPDYMNVKTKILRFHNSETKWLKNNLRPVVEGSQVLSSKAVKQPRVMTSQKPASKNAVVSNRSSANQRNVPIGLGLGLENHLSKFDSYKNVQLGVISTGFVEAMKPKVAVANSQLHSSQDPNFSALKTNQNSQYYQTDGFNHLKKPSGASSQFQSNSRQRFNQALAQSGDNKVMPKINPLSQMYQSAATQIYQGDKKSDKAINRKFKKLWRKNTYRSITQQMIIDNEIELKKQAKAAQMSKTFGEPSKQNLQRRQVNESYGLGFGTEELFLPQNQTPQKTTVDTQLSPSNKAPKSLSKFVKRDQKFQKLYEEQLKVWEEERYVTQKQETADVQEQSEQKFDTNLYKEREDNFPIVANRIMHHNLEKGRRYVNKNNASMLVESFDPIRIRLRVIPIAKAPVGKGKNSDFYFVEAGKKSLRGELPQALDLLRRGLAIDPKHFLCRFGHGVLQFKFGLVFEASQDFQELTQTNPNELYEKQSLPFIPLSLFNLAICLIQMGVSGHNRLLQTTQKQKSTEDLSSLLMTSTRHFERIVHLCQEVISLSRNGSDKFLIVDAYFLQAVSYYRLHKPLESVAAFNAGKRIRKRGEESQVYVAKKQNYDQIYADVMLQEVDKEIQKVEEKARKRRSSFEFKPHDLFNVKPQRKMSQDNHIVEKAAVDEANENNQITQEAKKEVTELNNLSTLKSEKVLAFQIPVVSSNPQLLDRQETQGNQSNAKSPDKFKTSQSPEKNLKGGVAGLSKQIRAQLRQMKKDLFPKIMLGQNIDTGAFEREFRFFQQSYASLVRMQDKIVDGDDPLRFRSLYLMQHDVEKGIFTNCNAQEKKELTRRYQLENWILDTEFLKAQLLEYLKAMDSQQDERLIDMILKIAPIKTRIVVGTDIDALRYVIADQKVLVDKMEVLQTKQKYKSQALDAELHHDEKLLFSQQITEDEIKVLSGQTGPQNLEEYKLGKKDILIERLQESLLKQNMTSDDVCNLLSNDLYEKEKKKSQLKNAQEINSSQRFACKHLQIIEMELVKNPHDRNFKLLDQLLSHLRYLKRLDRQIRRELYQIGTFIKVGPQETIFKQGDQGDDMYIILKGKISVQVIMPNRPSIQNNMSQCNDGDCFGELDLIDLNKVTVNKSSINKKSNQQRRATCIAIEESFLLRVNNESAKEIMQPNELTIKKMQQRQGSAFSSSVDSQSSQGRKAQELSQSKSTLSQEITPKLDDEVGRKIKFLKKFDFFKDIGMASLMPIAMNMQQVNFSFGEYIQKEGTVPKGLYLVKSGQCIVGKTELARRKHDVQNLPGGRKLMRDTKNLLLDNFDADNTPLNNLRNMKKAFQNNKVFISETGQPLKGEIHFENIIKYSTLLPGNWFGGRVLLPFEFYMSQRRIYFGQSQVQRPRSSSQQKESEESYQLKSFLNVIADSGVVETFLLTKTEMQYLRDSELKTIYESIVQVKEPDRPITEASVHQKLKEMQSWERLKIDTTNKILERHMMEKHGPGQVSRK